MKSSVFLAIAAVVAFLFGLAFILAPIQTMTMYGVNLDASGQYIARYLGSAFIGIACITWLARNADPKEKAARAVITGGFVMSLTGFVVALFDVFLGIGNSMVWSTVLIYLLLAFGFGNFQFKK